MADTEEQVEIAKLNLKDWEPGRGGNRGYVSRVYLIVIPVERIEFLRDFQN